MQAPLTLRELGRRTKVVMSGFDDVVVWNPGPIQAAKLADLPDEDWRRMLCVEAACIRTPARVAPGDTWAGRQALAA